MSRRSEGSRGEHPPWLQFSAAPQVPRSLTGTAGDLGSAMGWPWQSWACLRPWQTPSRVSPPTLTLQVVPSRAPSRLQAAPCTRSPWVASSAEKQPRSGGVQGPPHPIPGNEGLREAAAGGPGLGVILGKGQPLRGCLPVQEPEQQGLQVGGGVSFSPTLLRPRPQPAPCCWVTSLCSVTNMPPHPPAVGHTAHGSVTGTLALGTCLGLPHSLPA